VGIKYILMRTLHMDNHHSIQLTSVYVNNHATDPFTNKNKACQKRK